MSDSVTNAQMADLVAELRRDIIDLRQQVADLRVAGKAQDREIARLSMEMQLKDRDIARLGVEVTDLRAVGEAKDREIARPLGVEVADLRVAGEAQASAARRGVAHWTALVRRIPAWDGWACIIISLCITSRATGT